jgi:hypothetical protein
VNAVLKDGSTLEIRIVLDSETAAALPKVMARAIHVEAPVSGLPPPPSLSPPVVLAAPEPARRMQAPEPHADPQEFLLSVAEATDVVAVPAEPLERAQKPAQAVQVAADPSAAAIARMKRELDEARLALSARDRQLEEIAFSAPSPAPVEQFDASALFQKAPESWHDKPGQLFAAVGAVLVAGYLSFAVLAPALMNAATSPAPVVKSAVSSPGHVAAR